MYTEEEKNKIVNQTEMRMLTYCWEELEKFVKITIDYKIQEFCKQNPAIYDLLKNKELSIEEPQRKSYRD